MHILIAVGLNIYKGCFLSKKGVYKMKVDVIPTVDEIKIEDVYQRTVVIVDILRTSSTIISALTHDCIHIIPVETVIEAKQLKNHHPNYLVAGDRFNKKIPGFDLGNSPLSYTTASVSGKTIILTTTNGTRAIQKALKGENVLIGGFLNGTKCIEKALSLKKDIVLLAVGERGKFSFEDGIASGFLLDIIKNNFQDNLEVNDFGIAMYGLYKFYENNFIDVIKQTTSGKKIKQLGHEEDIDFSCQKNLYSICPYVHYNQQNIVISLED